MPDTWIFTEIMNRMGYAQPHLTPAEIMEATKALKDTEYLGGSKDVKFELSGVITEVVEGSWTSQYKNMHFTMKVDGTDETIFLRFIDGPKMAEKFWKSQKKNIYPIFNPENRTRPIVVCSASPEFFLKPICDEYKVDIMIATRMDPKTGRIDGFNCKDKQKPLRLAEALPDAEFINVYSDSLKNDIHIFELGQKCFHAQKGSLHEMSIEEIRNKVNK